MNHQSKLTVCVLLLIATAGIENVARAQSHQTQRQPKILWIVTDDQRADSIAAFNRIRHGKSDSRLGHVLSPNVDRLAAMGTTFTNTFNQNPGCAPSRTLMHTGRYSHRTGVYGFEYYNPVGQKHWRPMVPEILRDKAGYQTLAVGKLGLRRHGANVPGCGRHRCCGTRIRLFGRARPCENSRGNRHAPRLHHCRAHLGDRAASCDTHERLQVCDEDSSAERSHNDADNCGQRFDGVLVGKQTKADHGAAIRTELDFDDVDIRFDFRFAGGRSFNFVVDDSNEKSVHSGHICRASIFPKYLRISDDKTGSMNLEVRKQRQNKNLSPEETEALQEQLDRTQSSARINIERGKWHALRIRVHDDVMKAFLHGELVTSLRSPGFDHPTKTKFGFTVNGQAIEFDN